MLELKQTMVFLHCYFFTWLNFVIYTLKYRLVLDPLNQMLMKEWVLSPNLVRMISWEDKLDPHLTTPPVQTRRWQVVYFPSKITRGRSTSHSCAISMNLSRKTSMWSLHDKKVNSQWQRLKSWVMRCDQFLKARQESRKMIFSQEG